MARVPYVDKDVCNCCGLCIEDVPGVFQADEDMRAEVHDPRGDTEEAIQGVMDICPLACIHWKMSG